MYGGGGEVERSLSPSLSLCDLERRRNILLVRGERFKEDLYEGRFLLFVIF